MQFTLNGTQMTLKEGQDYRDAAETLLPGRRAVRMRCLCNSGGAPAPAGDVPGRRAAPPPPKGPVPRHPPAVQGRRSVRYAAVFRRPLLLLLCFQLTAEQPD